MTPATRTMAYAPSLAPTYVSRPCTGCYGTLLEGTQVFVQYCGGYHGHSGFNLWYCVDCHDRLLATCAMCQAGNTTHTTHHVTL